MEDDLFRKSSCSAPSDVPNEESALADPTERNAVAAHTDRRLRLDYQAALENEFNPRGIVECLLTREVARRAARVDAADAAYEALKRRAAQAFAELMPIPGENGGVDAAMLSQVASSERFDSIARRSLGESRAMLRALHEFRDVIDARLVGGRPDTWEQDPRFASEPACCIYLLRRLQHGGVACRRCGQRVGGNWIASRRCWQCIACHAQTCIRHRTVMAQSHVALPKWFHAMRIMLLQPAIKTSDLELNLGIRRATTVRSIRNKIRIAADSENATELLAGLDEIYLPDS